MEPGDGSFRPFRLHGKTCFSKVVLFSCCEACGRVQRSSNRRRAGRKKRARERRWARRARVAFRVAMGALRAFDDRCIGRRADRLRSARTWCRLVQGRGDVRRQIALDYVLSVEFAEWDVVALDGRNRSEDVNRRAKLCLGECCVAEAEFEAGIGRKSGGDDKERKNEFHDVCLRGSGCCGSLFCLRSVLHDLRLRAKKEL